MLVGGEYFKICDIGWGKEEADVVCQGFGYAGGLPTKNGYFPSTSGLQFGFMRFRCGGTEASLSSCRYDGDASNPGCDDGNKAGVICHGSERSDI